MKLGRKQISLCAAVFLAAAATALAGAPSSATPNTVAQGQLWQLVNPIIGTSGGVDTFPGPDVPFGMMQWSPDTSPTRPIAGGYAHQDSQLSGFSLTHLSGAGCGAEGDVPILPYVGSLPADPTSLTTSFGHGSETVQAGYYAVTTGAGRSAVTTELSTTARAGIGRFTFPAPATFVDNLEHVPVLLLVVADLAILATVDNGLDRQSIAGGASIYPFCHNLLLAARNEGLGGVLTTMLARQEPAVRELLGIPNGHAVAALIALGHPRKVITKLRRAPVAEFTVVDWS